MNNKTNPRYNFGEYKPFECGGEECNRIIPEAINWLGHEIVCSECGFDNGKLELVAGGIPMIKSYKILELVCLHCGQTISMRVEQFASIPECEKCDSIMLVNSVTTVNPKVKLSCLVLLRKSLRKRLLVLSQCLKKR
jgi:hypothetical protein